MKLLPAIELETKENPDSSIIWLHGLGADGNDFAPIVPELHLSEDMGVRFIFPHAPSIPVTVNGGMVMPAWYDIMEMQIDRQVDTTQLLLSVNAVSMFLDQEMERGIASRRILIAGFSQGGAVAYHTALSHSHPLGGLLAMSTYFATADIIQLNPCNKEIPIEVHHGLHDPVVPERLGRIAVNRLEEEGYSVKYRNYPMEHGVCAEQIDDISHWIKERLQ